MTPSLTGSRVLRRSWVLACTLAEAIGMTAAAAAARAATALIERDVQGASWLGLGLVVLGGLVEGVALGVLQSRALASVLDTWARRRWLWGTVLIAGVGWAAASAPAALSSSQSGDTEEPALMLVLLGAAGLGTMLGAVLGAVQAWALTGQVPHPRRWILGSAVGWTAAMPVIFLGATTVPASWPTGPVVVIGAGTGLAAGLVLGATSAPFLRMLGSSPSHNVRRSGRSDDHFV